MSRITRWINALHRKNKTLLFDFRNFFKCIRNGYVEIIRVAPQCSIDDKFFPVQRTGRQRDGSTVKCLIVVYERDCRWHDARVFGAVQTVGGGLLPFWEAARSALVQTRHLMNTGKRHVRSQCNHFRATARGKHVSFACCLPEGRERRARR